MHVNTVKVNGIWVKYQIENVHIRDNIKGAYDEIMITAEFTQNGKMIYKEYGIRTPAYSGAEMISALLDNNFAASRAEEIINDANKSMHSPFRNVETENYYDDELDR